MVELKDGRMSCLRVRSSFLHLFFLHQGCALGDPRSKLEGKLYIEGILFT